MSITALHKIESLVPNDSIFKIRPKSIKKFTNEQLIHVYKTMLLSRRLDEKMLNLLKQGKGHFHIGASGHEAAQLAASIHLTPRKDWGACYYRDMAFALGMGMTPRQLLSAHLSRVTDTSHGKQMPSHFNSKELRLLSVNSAIGAQYLPGLGIAQSIQYEGLDEVVYISGGDGGTSQGSFFELLNWASRTKAPTVIVVQDNKYAISVPIVEQTSNGSISKTVRGFENLTVYEVDGTDFFHSAAAFEAAIERARKGDGPTLIHAHVVRLLPHSSSDDQRKYRDPDDLEEDLMHDPISQFEQRLLAGRILDENDFVRIREEVKKQIDDDTKWVLSQTEPKPEDALLYVYSSKDLALNYESSTPSGEPIVMVDAINHAIAEEMEINDKVIVFGEDVSGGKGGVFTATRGLTEKFGKKRCYNSPLSEASILGTAVGLAVNGFKPVVEIQFGDYIWPGMQQLRNQIPTLRYRSHNQYGCPMVIRVPIGGYIHGGLCHSQNIESFFALIPGYKIVMPSNSADAKGLLKTAIRSDDPVMFLEHKFLYRQGFARKQEPASDYYVQIGKANLIREGTDVTVVTYGALVQKAIVAAKQLEQQGVSVEIIDLRSIVPLDIDTVLTSVAKTGKALVLYEDIEFCGFGSELAAQIAEKAFHYLDAPVQRLASHYAPIAFAVPMEEYILPSDDTINAAIRKLIKY